MLWFQSTHPRGVRHNPRAPALTEEQRFNPRTRVGCDSAIFYSLMGFNTFQSTHPRGVRQQLITGQILIILVSIHAPAWGATGESQHNAIFFEVSIHAPAWGATGPHEGRGKCFAGFNPRTRVGCDTDPRAPALTEVQRFNPRTRVGCDGIKTGMMNTGGMFQSTHPRGVRHQLREAFALQRFVSIHAPAWGATE